MSRGFMNPPLWDEKNIIFCNGSEKPEHGNVQAESINGLKNVYGLQFALHLPEGS